jgi:hypothetical protein
MERFFMKPSSLLVLVLCWLPVSTLAVDGKSDFEMMLEQNSKVKTRESEVTLHDIHYKKVEYKNNVYYIAFAQPNASQTDLNVICEQEGVLLYDPPPRIEAQIQVVERSSLFVEGLQDACGGKNGQRRAIVVPATKLGLTIPDSKDSVLKNKKVYVDPLAKQLGFKGNW